MRLALSPSRRSLLAVLPFLVACASTGAPSLAATTAEPSGAEIGAAEAGPPASRPHIWLTVLPQATNTRFIDAEFHVSENAYAFVALVDLDRRIRVLYPESPSESRYVPGNARYELRRFFAGFGGTSLGQSSRYRLATYNTAFAHITPYEGGGVIVAVSSDRPLQLGRLTDADGEWDEDALDDFLMNTSPNLGVRAIGRALTVTGQEFTTDIAPISDARLNGSMAFRPAGCLGSQYDFGAFDDFGYGGYGAQARYAPSRVPVGRFVVNGRTFMRFAQTDACGVVTFVDVPVIVPAKPADTSATRIATSAFRIPVHADQGAAIERPWLRPRGTEGDAWNRAAARAPRGQGASDTRGLMSVDRPAVHEASTITPRERVRPRESRPVEPSATVRTASPAPRQATQPRSNQ